MRDTKQTRALIPDIVDDLEDNEIIGVHEPRTGKQYFLKTRWHKNDGMVHFTTVDSDVEFVNLNEDTADSIYGENIWHLRITPETDDKTAQSGIMGVALMSPEELKEVLQTGQFHIG